MLILLINSLKVLTFSSFCPFVYSFIRSKCYDLLYKFIFRYALPKLPNTVSKLSLAICCLQFNGFYLTSVGFVLITFTISMRYGGDLEQTAFRVSRKTWTLIQRMSTYTMLFTDDLLNTTSASSSSSRHNEQQILSSHSPVINDPCTMAEFGPDLQSQLQLNTSYMDYLEDAHRNIQACRLVQ